MKPTKSWKIVQRICPVVLSAAVDPRGDVGTSLRRVVGMMGADFNMINLPTFCIALGIALDLARHSYATLVTMDRVRKAALAETPKSLPAVLCVNAIVRLTLCCEARIIAFMTFRSREEVDRVSDAMNEAFSETSEAAADSLDAGTYMALIRLHGDVTAHLADRGRQLPRVIRYEFQQVMSSLRMAQRAYADPKRYKELINENHVVHPAFMPRVGKMLAV
ncbi:prophage DNA circulation protein [Bradyrhizobium sp. S3.14.4]